MSQYQKSDIFAFYNFALCSGKQPPPNFKKPICMKPPCLKRRIKVKVYVEDTLWKMMSRDGSDPTKHIIKKMEKIFEGIDKHLANLDNGGYMIEFDKKVVKLGNSDVVLKETYVDRANRNVTKVFTPNKIWALTFAFQESVALLRDRNAVDLRILMAKKRRKDPSNSIGLAEEYCLCNPETFACIATFGIENIRKWARNKERYQKQPRKGRGMVSIFVWHRLYSPNCGLG